MSSKSKLGCAIDAAAFGAQLWSRLRARSILPPLHAGVGGQLEILLVSGQKKKTCLCFGERRSCVSGRRHRIDGGPPFKATAATLRVHIAPTGAGNGDFRVHLARSARPQGGSRAREGSQARQIAKQGNGLVLLSPTSAYVRAPHSLPPRTPS